MVDIKEELQNKVEEIKEEMEESSNSLMENINKTVVYGAAILIIGLALGAIFWG